MAELLVHLSQIYKIMLENRHLHGLFLCQNTGFFLTLAPQRIACGYTHNTREGKIPYPRQLFFRHRIMGNEKDKNPRLARCLATGILFGVAIGAGMDNIAVGIALGLALGAIYHRLTPAPDKEEGDEKQNNDSAR